MIRKEIAKLIEKSIKELQKEKKLPRFKVPEILVEEPGEKSHGDYSSNIALLISKSAKQNPMDTAKIIAGPLDQSLFAKVEIAKPGFINFWIKSKFKNIIMFFRN